MTEKSCEMPSRQIRIERESLLRRDRGYWVIRRGQDILFSLLALIILFIPMVIVALAIVWDDPGCSPIFSQMRVGRDGKQFRLYKFRSMVVNAETLRAQLKDRNEMKGPVFKIKDDPRITKVGRFLRKTSIDELPQLWNVLRGDMSIVGPRPALPEEVKQYDEYARQRLLVSPGLTCYWQIQPNRNSLDFDEWLELDLKYIENRSFAEDWIVILKTVRAVVMMNGE